MKYHIITYGCQMNHSDSERIATVLALAGITPAKDMNNADLLIINSCSVRQSAINRIYGQLRNFQRRPGLRQTILTGCVLEADKKKFKDKFDLIIDIQELAKNPDKLIKSLGVEGQEFKAFSYTDYFKINPQYRSNFSAYIPIMTGCNNFCSYCAVPYARGREMSRPAQKIIAEVKRLVDKGYKEITLLGQNVNSYRSINNKQLAISSKRKVIDFPKLLKMINEIPGDFWIRFLTSHPKDMSSELIKIMAKCAKVCEYVHLPIQAGDDEILRKMNRHYTADHYLKLIEKIKKAYYFRHCEKRSEGATKQSRAIYNKQKIATLSACWQKARNDKSDTWHPPIAISTDIIVGFPGETKIQFENTAKIMRKVKYDMAYLAEYSPRPGTAAAKLEDNVPITEKKRRKEFLNDILRKTALGNNKKYIGKIVEVLIEKIEGDFAYGKTRTFKNVKIPLSVIARTRSAGWRTGTKQSRSTPSKKEIASLALAMTKIKPCQFVKVKITKAGAWGLEGKII